jgi:hypothetical protein
MLTVVMSGRLQLLVAVLLLAKLMLQVLDIPARVAAWRDEGWRHQGGLPPANESAAVNPYRPGRDAGRHELVRAGHRATMSPEWGRFISPASLATISYECNDRVVPAQTTHTGWWAESISDGGAHYGAVQSDTGTVHSACGRVFTPLPNPWTRTAEPQHQPADPAHGCRACKAAKRPTPASS